MASAPYFLPFPFFTAPSPFPSPYPSVASYPLPASAYTVATAVPAYDSSAPCSSGYYASQILPAPCFPSPITTQINPNHPPHAAPQTHGYPHHTYSPDLQSPLPIDLCSPTARLLDATATSIDGHADLSYSKADEARTSLGYDSNDLASDLPAAAANLVTFGSKEGRVLTVKLHHKVCPISMETLHRIFLSCGVVEKMIYTADVHSPRVFIQYQSDQMAAHAIWVLQGKCIHDTYCQLEIQLAQGSDLHAFQDYSCEMNFQSGSGGYNVGLNNYESPGEEHKRETVQQIPSYLPGPNTDGFDTMDHKAQPVDRRMMFLNMLAPIQAKLQNISEKLSQDIKRMESRASKQQTAPRINPSTQQAINVTNGKPLYGLYDEEANGRSIDLCTMSHTNLIIQRDGEGKQETEDTSSSKASKNETPSEQPPMSAPATDQMQFQAFESMPKFDEYMDEDSVCLNITSDVQDFTLELQPQDDEGACSFSVLKASDSYVTRCNKLVSAHVLSGLRHLWDPGALTFLVTPLNNDNNNDTIGVFNEAVLDIPPAKPPERYGSADSSLQGILLKVLPTQNSSAYTNSTLLSCNSKQFSAILAIQSTCFLLEAIPSWQRGVSNLENSAISTLWHTTTTTGDKIYGYLNAAAKSQNLFPCISTSDTEHICILVKLWPWSIFSAQHIPDSSTKKGIIFSSGYILAGNPWSAILLLHYFLWEYSMDRVLGKTAVPNLVHRSETPIKLLIFIDQPVDLKHFLFGLLLQCQTWCHTLNDFPKIQSCCLPIVLYCPYSVPVCYSSKCSSTSTIISAMCMSTASMVRMILVSVSGIPIQEENGSIAVYQVSKIQLPMRKTTRVWDPGTMLLSCKCKWWLLYTEEKINWLKEIKCYGDALWLINFQPP